MNGSKRSEADLSDDQHKVCWVANPNIDILVGLGGQLDRRMQFVITMNSGAACIRIYWARGRFYTLIWLKIRGSRSRKGYRALAKTSRVLRLPKPER